MYECNLPTCGADMIPWRISSTLSPSLVINDKFLLFLVPSYIHLDNTQVPHHNSIWSCVCRYLTCSASYISNNDHNTELLHRWMLPCAKISQPKKCIRLILIQMWSINFTVHDLFNRLATFFPPDMRNWYNKLALEQMQASFSFVLLKWLAAGWAIYSLHFQVINSRVHNDHGASYNHTCTIVLCVQELRMLCKLSL